MPVDGWEGLHTKSEDESGMDRRSTPLRKKKIKINRPLYLLEIAEKMSDKKKKKKEVIGDNDLD